MQVHGIMCSYLGDGELDLGTTSRWLESFVDTIFYFDLGYGDQPGQFSVDYARTFPEAKFAYHNPRDPAIWTNASAYRKEAFDAAMAAWSYSVDDWVIFVDASESLAIDVSRDHLTPPAPSAVILSYLYEEATSGVIAFPYYVFLQQGPITEHDYDIDPQLASSLEQQRDALIAAEPDMDPDVFAKALDDIAALEVANTAVYWSVEPTVMQEPTTRYLDRMFNVAALSSLNWASLDTFGASIGDHADHCGIVSYAYARDIPAPAALADDIGFNNRLLTQQFRNVGLTGNWATADPAGTHVSVTGRAVCPSYCYYIDQHDFGDKGVDGLPVLTAVQKWTGLFRQNPRDGVWYLDYDLGPVPVDPVTGGPSVPPSVWDSQPTTTTGPNAVQSTRQAMLGTPVVAALDDFDRADGAIGSDWVLGVSDSVYIDSVVPFTVESGAAVGYRQAIGERILSYMVWHEPQSMNQSIEIELTGGLWTSDHSYPDGYAELYTHANLTDSAAEYASFTFGFDPAGPNIYVLVWPNNADGSKGDDSTDATWFVGDAGDLPPGGSPVEPIRLRLESDADGTQRVYINGALVVTWIDPAPRTGQYIGMALNPTQPAASPRILQVGARLS